MINDPGTDVSFTLDSFCKPYNVEKLLDLYQAEAGETSSSSTTLNTLTGRAFFVYWLLWYPKASRTGTMVKGRQSPTIPIALK